MADVDVFVFLPDSFAYAARTDSMGNFTLAFPRSENSFRYELSSASATVSIVKTSMTPNIKAPDSLHFTFSVTTLPVFISDSVTMSRNGLYKNYYAGGQVYFYGTQKNGQREGTWYCFYENGQLWSRGTYVNGVRQGFAVTYHANGKKSTEGFYKNGKMTGAWKFWDENGTLLENHFGD